MIIDFMREHPYFCTSAGTCVAGFMSYATPYLQFVALCISIVAGVYSIKRNRRKP